MAIGIIPKDIRTETPSWVNILFYFAVVLLVLTAGSYIALDYFGKKFQTEKSDLEEAVAREKIAFTEDERFVKGYKAKIEDFAFLIESHPSPVNFFTLLENSTHPRVWFNNSSLDTVENKALLNGFADDFEVLGQQIIVLRREKLFEKVNLSQVSLGKEGDVSFSLEIVLSPRVFVTQ